MLKKNTLKWREYKTSRSHRQQGTIELEFEVILAESKHREHSFQFYETT